MLLPVHIDTELRRYACNLDRTHGEDAYHDMVVRQLGLARRNPIRDARGYYRRAIKYSLYNYYRNHQARVLYERAWALDAPSQNHANLAKGRTRRTHCQKGHEYTLETTVAIGPGRTCVLCKRASQNAYRRTQRTRQKEKRDGAATTP